MHGIKDRVLGSVVLPSIPSLADGIENCGLFELISYYCILKINYNLFSFLSGIVATFPVTVLFVVLELKIDESIQSVCRFFVYCLILLFSVLMSIKITLFTLTHIDIIQYASNEQNREVYVNKIAEAFLNNSSKLSNNLVDFIVCSAICLSLMIMQIVVTNAV